MIVFFLFRHLSHQKFCDRIDFYNFNRFVTMFVDYVYVDYGAHHW